MSVREYDKLIGKTSDHDKDERYMATNDLIRLLQQGKLSVRE